MSSEAIELLELLVLKLGVMHQNLHENAVSNMTEMEYPPPPSASKLLLNHNYALISMTGSGHVCVQDKKPFSLYKDNTVRYLHVKI